MDALRPPHRLLLDTNLVVLSWRYRLGDEGFDLIGALRLLASEGQERLALDLLSLEELLAIARLAGTPQFVVAPVTLEELERSNDDDAPQVLRWASELATYSGIREDWAADRASRLASELLAPEVSGADATLLAEVARIEADALVTCDYRLIRRREKGLRLKLPALTPLEVEDWIQGCRLPPWRHASSCRARLSRLALLTEKRRGLRLGDSGRASEELVRVTK